MTNGLFKYGEIFEHFFYSSYIRKPFLIYDFATAPLWISLYMRKIWFSFLSVCGTYICILCRWLTTLCCWWGTVTTRWWGRTTGPSRTPGARPGGRTVSSGKQFFFKLYIFGGDSSLLHLPPLRFHCANGCWDRIQDQIYLYFLRIFSCAQEFAQIDHTL